MTQEKTILNFIKGQKQNHYLTYRKTLRGNITFEYSVYKVWLWNKGKLHNLSVGILTLNW